jgi:hypothetical protein
MYFRNLYNYTSLFFLSFLILPFLYSLYYSKNMLHYFSKDWRKNYKERLHESASYYFIIYFILLPISLFIIKYPNSFFSNIIKYITIIVFWLLVLNQVYYFYILYMNIK